MDYLQRQLHKNIYTEYNAQINCYSRIRMKIDKLQRWFLTCASKEGNFIQKEGLETVRRKW